MFAVLVSYDSSAKHTALKTREELGPASSANSGKLTVYRPLGAASSAKQNPAPAATVSQLGVIPDA